MSRNVGGYGRHIYAVAQSKDKSSCVPRLLSSLLCGCGQQRGGDSTVLHNAFRVVLVDIGPNPIILAVINRSLEASSDLTTHLIISMVD